MKYLFSNLMLTELLFVVVWVVAFLILLEFIKSRDGQLRKIMIAYFSVEVFIYLCSAIYFYLVYINKSPISVDLFRVMIIIPKVCIKLWLLYYLKFGRNSKKLVNS